MKDVTGGAEVERCTTLIIRDCEVAQVSSALGTREEFRVVVAVPVLVRVTAFCPEVAPVFSIPKSSAMAEVEITWALVVPMPSSPPSCGLPGPLSVT